MSLFLPENEANILYDAVRSARERGLRQMRVHLVGTTDPQWQISSRFAHSSGFHISIGSDFAQTLLQALNPPTGQTPVEAPEPAPAPAPAPIGLFD